MHRHIEIIYENGSHEGEERCIGTVAFKRLQDVEFLSIKDLQ